LGGGFKGTGVPLTLTNCRIDQRARNAPMVKNKIDKMKPPKGRRSLGNPKNRSIIKEKRINRKTKEKKMSAPTGVRRVRTVQLLVAAL
jgi:hypothetical protein